MNFQTATKHLLNEAGLYINNTAAQSPAQTKATTPLQSAPVIRLKSRKKTSSAKTTKSTEKISTPKVLRKKSVHPVAQAIYDKLQEAQKIERNISKTLHKVQRLDYVHPNNLITHSQVTGLGLYSVKKLKRQAKKQNFDFFCCDLSQQKTLAGFFSKMCADLKFPKPRGGVRGHFVKQLKVFFKKNPQSDGIIIVLDNIKLKTQSSNDLYFHIRDSLDKICEGWVNYPQIIRIFCSVSYGFDEKKVVHLVPFI